MHIFKISKKHTENSSDRVRCFGRLVYTIDMVEKIFKEVITFYKEKYFDF